MLRCVAFRAASSRVVAEVAMADMPRADGETREPSHVVSAAEDAARSNPVTTAGPGPGPGASAGEGRRRSLLLRRCAPVWLPATFVWLPTSIDAPFPVSEEEAATPPNPPNPPPTGAGREPRYRGRGRGSDRRGRDLGRSTPRGTRPRPRRGTCPTSWKGFSAKGGGSLARDRSWGGREESLRGGGGNEIWRSACGDAW